MDFRSMKLAELNKAEQEKYIRPKEFYERTIAARIINPLQLSGYRELVNAFLENDSSYRIAVANPSDPMQFFREDFIYDKDRLCRYIAKFAQRSHIKRNHILIDLRKKEDGEYYDGPFTVYFSENEALELMRGEERRRNVLEVSKLFIPRDFAHCFTLEDNLRDKINFYSRIEAIYISDYKKLVSAGESAKEHFEDLFVKTGKTA